MKHLTENLILRSHDTWKTRNDFVHGNNLGHLSMYRLQLLHLWKNLLDEPTKLGRFKYLLDKTSMFFKFGREHSLKLWKYRVDRGLEETIEDLKKQPTLFRAWNINPPKRRMRRSSSLPRGTLTRRSRRKRLEAQRRIIARTTPITNFVTGPEKPLMPENLAIFCYDTDSTESSSSSDLSISSTSSDLRCRTPRPPPKPNIIDVLSITNTQIAGTCSPVHQPHY